MQIETYTLPAHWAPALTCGDESGFSEEEERTLSEWLRENVPQGCYIGYLDVTGEPEFTPWHDAPEAGACECLTYTFIFSSKGNNP